MSIDETYHRAAAVTGKTVPQLEAMARQVFASMLHHALDSRGRLVWTVSRISSENHLDLEVNVPRRGSEKA